MSNGEAIPLPAAPPLEGPLPLPADNLYHVVDSQTVADFDSQGTVLIRQGYAPLGAMTVYNLGANVHYLQAFWRQEAVATFMTPQQP
jgi:hypothetical protein